MASVHHGGSSDVSSAYQRAIAREENEATPEQHIGDPEISKPGIHAPHQAKLEVPVDEDDSDLYRHHSQQQSVEGG